MAVAAAAAKQASPARRAAFEILARVGAGKGHCDELLQGHLLQPLSQEDRNLATALVMGVLRWQIALDARLAPLLNRPQQKLAEPVAIALRMGAFQLLHMDRIPAHAAISESVELCRAADQPHATGLVNAVLRKIAAGRKPANAPAAGGADLSPSKKPSVAETATMLAHPLWLVERWAEGYGETSAAAICRAGQEQPPAVLRCIADDAAHLVGAEEAALMPGRLLTAARTGPAANVTTLATHHPALFHAMDEGSQLVAEIAAFGVRPGGQISDGRRPDGRILDCCAAPGGKTLVLASRNPTREIVAADTSQRRLDEMRRRLQQVALAGNVVFVRADAGVASQQPPLTGLFERILCDAPCSGTGTLARNPEIRHRLKPENLPLYAERQKTILKASLERLAPGGRLIYSTCSLEREENEDVVAACVGEGFRVVDVREILTALSAGGVLAAGAAEMLLSSAVRGKYLRTLPGVHPCDGFFAAVIERAA